MPRTKERPDSARKIIREKSSGRGAHRADLLSAYRAWRKVVRATRPERVVLFAPPGILVLPPSAETTTARFSSESAGLHGLCFRSSSSAAACRLCRLCTGTGREAKRLLFFATRISVLGQNYKKAAALREACAPFCFALKACVHNGVPRVLSQGPDAPVPKRARSTPPPPPLPLPATKNSERSPTKPVTRPRPHVRTARVGPKGARSMYNVRSTVCARLSLSLWRSRPGGGGG